MNSISFREARSSDADAIGALHVASWRETYSGILPDELLDGLSGKARSEMWRGVLSGHTSGTVVFVAESESEIVGFGACGGQRDNELKRQGFGAEIGAIYVLQAHQRAGVGNALMRLMAQSLLRHGQNAASLWVLRENAGARDFYERLGGALIREKTEELSDATLSEVAYGWSDLRSTRHLMSALGRNRTLASRRSSPFEVTTIKHEVLELSQDEPADRLAKRANRRYIRSFSS